MQISRVKRSKQDARIAYDRMSAIYDLLAGSSETPLMRLGLHMLGISEGQSVLEIGSGTGKALSELSESVGKSGGVYGFDLSSGMLHRSKARFRKSSLGNRVSLVQGDGARLPFINESFNAIFISFTLELFDTPDIPHVIEDCHRVLQPDGRLGVVAMLKPEQPGWIVRLYEWFHERIPDYVDCRPILAGTLIAQTGFNLEQRQVKSMWGLPVEILVARKTSRSHS